MPRALPPNVYAVKYKTKRGFHRTLYYVRFQDWKGIRRNFPAGPDPEVAAGLAIKKKALNVDRFDFDAAAAAPTMPTLAAWADECLTLQRRGVKIARTKIRASTIAWEEDQLRHLKEFFGREPLTSITLERIAEYEAWRAAAAIVRQGKRTAIAVKPASISAELTILRKYLRYAWKRGVIPAAPPISIPARKKRTRVLSDKEYRELLDAAPRWLARILIVARETCLSRGDLIRLDDNMVNEDEGVIEPAGGRVKTAVRQMSPITPAVAAVLAEIRAERKKIKSISKLLFTRDGKPISENALYRALERALKKAKIENFRLHDMRHTAKTRWATGRGMPGGRPIPVDAAMLGAGHASVQMHIDYTHLQRSDVARAFGVGRGEAMPKRKRGGNREARK